MGKIKVVYIMGAGRSGSTVLDTVLGSHPQVVSVGELVNAPSAFSNPLEYCACGEQAGDCTFWLAVQREWCKVSGYKAMGELLKLQKRYERVHRLPYLWWSRLLNTRGYKQYLQAQTALFQAIAAVSGKQIIVDSSKSPVRAFALAKIPEIAFSAVHLVRDGRGVVWSLMKSYKKDPKSGVQKDLRAKPAWRTSLFWLMTNILSEMLFVWKFKCGRIRVRYENFVEHTEDTLDEISAFLGVDYSCIESQIASEKKLHVGHAVAGNRVRMTGAIKLNPDYEWKKQLPKRHKRMFWFIAWPLAVMYGYKRNQVS